MFINNGIFWLNSMMKKIIIVLFILATGFLFGLIYSNFTNENLPSSVYRISYDAAWSPLELYDKERDLSAFSEEIVRAIAVEEHLPLEVIPLQSENLLEFLDRGNYKGILSSISLQPEEEDKYLSSNPYYLLGPVLVVPKSSNVKLLNELKNQDVGIINDSDELFLRNYKDIHFVFYDYDDLDKMADDVSNHVIQGMILNLIPAYEYTENGLYQNQLKVVTAPLNQDGLRLITKNNPDSKELIKHFNAGLKAIKKNGTYKKKLSKWDLFEPMTVL